MAQDPIRAQKADRWDALVSSGVSPSEATKQVESEFRRAPQAPQAPAARRQPSLKATEEAKGLTRSLAQGLTFGFGEELESLPYALPGGESPQEARTRIRGEMAQYKAARPVISTAAEFAGGMVPGLGTASMAAKAGTSALRGVGRLLTGGMAQGALTGAGTAEGDLAERAPAAVLGGTVGGATGYLGGKVLGKGVETMRRGRLRPRPGVQAVEEAMEATKTTPAQLSTRAQQLAQESPEARVMDVLGQPGVRIARRIEALGGEGGERVGQTMRERLGGRPERMQNVLTRTTGKAREDVVQTLEEMAEARAQAAAPLYEAVRQQPPVVSESMESLIKQRGSLRDAERKALQLAEEDGVQLPLMDTGGEQATPLRTPQFLDYMKRALDDRIYKGKQPGEGGLGPEEMRLLKKTRAEFVQMLDTNIPGYAEARDAYAGPTALMNAMREAEDFAKRTVKPGEIRKAMDELTSKSEREFFQRGWLNAQIDKVDAGSLTARQIRTPLYEKQIREVFGDQTDQIMRGLLTEVNLAESAGQIVGGSRTAPLQQDIAREQLGRTAEALRNVYTTVRNDPVYAGARAIDIARERLAGPRLASARAEKAQALMTPASQFGSLLDAVNQEFAARQAGRTTGRVASGALGSQSVRTLADLLRGR